MKKVGILVGREKSFPVTLIEKVNARGGGEVVAEMVEVGGVRHDEGRRYDLIVDRISHEVPFYRAFLKRAALEGTIIINNPFWWSADDKFFNYSLAEKLGVAVPRTVLLPQKDYIEGIVSESLRNLEFPLDWEGICDYVGFPAFIKPHDGGGWKNVSKVNSLEELWQVYDTTGTLCMTLQAAVDFDLFVRCYCIGQEEVMIMPYDPSKPYLSGEQYRHDPNYLPAPLAERVADDVRKLCRALGYDINTCEMAIQGDIPYAIDFMNPAPDAERASVGDFYHEWVTDAVAELIFKRLGEERPAPRYRWDSLLNPGGSGERREGGQAEQGQSQSVSAVASAAEQAARTIIPQPVREIPADIAAGVTDLVEEAKETVANIINTVTGAEETNQETTPTPTPAPAKRARSSAAAAKSTKAPAKKSAAPRSKKPTTEA